MKADIKDKNLIISKYSIIEQNSTDEKLTKNASNDIKLNNDFKNVNIQTDINMDNFKINLNGDDKML